LEASLLVLVAIHLGQSLLVLVDHSSS